LSITARPWVDLVAPVWELGYTSDLGKRRIILITGGKFEGLEVEGKRITEVTGRSSRRTVSP
jgi:hypothetical protein